LVFQRARISGAIQGRPPSWHSNRTLLERGIARPKSRAGLVTAEIAYGLGELLAYTQMGSVPGIAAMRGLSEANGTSFLDAVTEIANAQHPPPAIDEVTARQMLQKGHLDAEVMQYAFAFLEHPRHPRPRMFGLSTVIESLAKYRPEVLGRWLTKPHSSALDHTVLGYLAERLIFASDDDPIHGHLLRSRNPLLQALVTQSFVTRHWGQIPKGFRPLFEMCRGAGILAEDAFILALPGATNATSPLHFARKTAAKAQEALAFNKLRPPAPGSNSNADLSDKAKNAADGLQTAELSAAQAIEDMATLWPADGLSPQGVTFLQLSTGLDRSVIRFRLAEQLPPSPARTALLENIVDDLGQMLDIDHPAVSVQHRVYQQPDDYLQTVHWCGAAMRLRSEGEAKGVGQRTSQFVGPLVAAGRAITDAPFAAARRPHYGAALSKRIAACIFALRQSHQEGIVLPDLAILAQHSLAEAEKALAADVSAIGDEAMFDQLAVDAIGIMTVNDKFDRREAWAADPAISKFARALAVWTSRPLVEARPDLAEALFLQVGRLNSSRHNVRAQNRACLLLDAGLANCSGDDRATQQEDIRRLWQDVYQTWPLEARENAALVFDALIDALAGGANGKAFVLTDPNWSQTRCGQIAFRT
jgi:hypothetical protein